MKKSFLAAAILVTLGLSVIRANSTPTIQKMSPTPICFTENKGQWHEDVKFRCDAGGAIVWICKDRVVYQFLRRVGAPPLAVGTDSQSFFPNDPLDRFNQEPDSIEQLVITARFVDANPNAKVSGDAMMEYKCNYFIGNDPNKWHTDVPNYEAVTLADVYDGVDLQLFAGENGSLMYRYDIAPSAYQERVKVEYEGLEQSTFDDNGRMVTQTRWGEINGLLAIPANAAEFVGLHSDEMLADTEAISFESRNPHAIQLVYSTYLGGTAWDSGNGIAVDSGGRAHVTGRTFSSNFPTLSAYDGNSNGDWEVFVCRFSTAGNTLEYSTYLGGSAYDAGSGIAVDAVGSAYVTGFTESSNFPTQNAYDGSLNGGPFAPYDVFVCKLSSSGNALVYSTYLGGSSDDRGHGVAFDASGSAYVTGITGSSNFPMQDAYDGSFSGGPYDVFVSKFSDAGNALVYSTYLGGSEEDIAFGIAVDDGGSTFVTGRTLSSNFPTQNAYDGSSNGDWDAFVSKLSAVGNALVYSTYLGGAAWDAGNGIAIDASSGTAYVIGYTTSSNFPTQDAYDASFNGGDWDVFVTKFSDVGNVLVYSTYLGGSANDVGGGIAVDAAGSAHVTGYTMSSNFPMQNAYDGSHNGGWDAFVTKFPASGNALDYSTYLGGSDGDYGLCIAVDTSGGGVFVTGHTASSNFPTQNAYDGSFDGDSYDAFVSKFGVYACGDVDGYQMVTMSDAVHLINYIFSGGSTPVSLVAGDANCSGNVNISDAVYLINYLSFGGPAPCAACP